MSAKIILFTGENCPACQSAEAFLDNQAVEYEEMKVEDVEEYARALGILSIPAIIVKNDGMIADMYVGFQGKRYMEILHKNGVV